MKKMKPVWKYTILILLLLSFVAAVCLLPWPTRINMSLNGMIVTADGEVDYKADFSVKGWKLNYLFKEDTFSVTVDFPRNLRNVAIQDGKFENPHSFDGLYYFAGYAMDALNKGMVPCTLVLDISKKQCFVNLSVFEPGIYLVGAVAEETDPKEILNTFSVFVE